MARGAVIVIVSDGWDTGDPADLGEQMARLSRLAHRVVWVNPRKAAAGYQPLVAGMAAALPHVDAFVSGHTVDALDEVLAAIAAPTRDRSSGRGQTVNADGQMSASTQASQRGLRATHTARPCRIRRRLSAPRSVGPDHRVELELDLDRIGLGRQPQAGRQPQHVGVDGQAGLAHGHAAHHVAGLAAHAREGDEVGHAGAAPRRRTGRPARWPCP